VSGHGKKGKRGKQRNYAYPERRGGVKMPYGLKNKDFDKIQNEIVKKLYEIPSLDRATFLVGCTEQELREAMTELRKTPKSRGKIEAVERELRNRGNKNKKTKFFPSDLAEKRFVRE
jgi:hypothetical protein